MLSDNYVTACADCKRVTLPLCLTTLSLAQSVGLAADTGYTWNIEDSVHNGVKTGTATTNGSGVLVMDLSDYVFSRNRLYKLYLLDGDGASVTMTLDTVERECVLIDLEKTDPSQTEYTLE